MNNPFVGFAPWLIFWVVANPSTWEYASGAALIAAVILAIPSVERGSLKMLDVVTIAFFAVVTVLGLILDASELDWFEDYSQAISSGVLGLVVLGSLAFVPFTEQYAREQAPREVWDSPRFKRVNRVLTATWGAVFAAAAVLGVIAQQTDSSSARDWLNWVLPIALVIGGFKFSAWYAAQSKAEGAAAAEPQPGVNR